MRCPTARCDEDRHVLGRIAGQIAKIHGCRVVGIAGGPQKCAWLVDELGFDATIDYNSQDVRKELRTAAPDGVDVYFDNVGGEILDAVLTRIARGARIVICGAVSQYNEGAVSGPSNYLMLLVARARMEGMVVFDYAGRFPQAGAEMAAACARAGSSPARTSCAAPSTTSRRRCCSEQNTGKLALQIA